MANFGTMLPVSPTGDITNVVLFIFPNIRRSISNFFSKFCEISMAPKTGTKVFKSTLEKPVLFPKFENLKPTKKVKKNDFPALKIQKNLTMKNFDCSSFIPFTQKLNFVPISPKSFFRSTSKI